MKKVLLPACFLATLVGCNEEAEEGRTQVSSSSAAIVHGTNSIKNIWQESDLQLKTVANSVALITVKSAIKTENSLIYPSDTNNPTFKNKSSMCSGQPFVSEQVITPSGTAFLVSPTHVATAGHTINGLFQVVTGKSKSTSEAFTHQELSSLCLQLQFVFNYQYNNSTSLTNPSATNDVYSCKRIHRHRGNNPDFAIIELDRPSNLSPIPFSDDPDPTALFINGTPARIVGHPAGLPKKIATGVFSTSISQGNILTNLDNLAGNSGSPTLAPSGSGGFLSVGIFVEDPGGADAIKVVQDGAACNILNTTSDTNFSARSTPMNEAFGTFLGEDKLLLSEINVGYNMAAGESTSTRGACIFAWPNGGRIGLNGPAYQVPLYISRGKGIYPSNHSDIPNGYTMAPFQSMHAGFPPAPYNQGLIKTVDFGDTGGSSSLEDAVFVYEDKIVVGETTSFYNISTIPRVTNSNICSSNNGSCLVGDVSGDGRVDVVGIDNNGSVFVQTAHSTSIVPQFNAKDPFAWLTSFRCDLMPCDIVPSTPLLQCNTKPACVLADVNGDRKADLVRFQRGDGLVAGAKVEVALSTGFSFQQPTVWHDFFCPDNVYIPLPGDRPPPLGSVPNVLWANLSQCFVRDMSGDGMADAVWSSKYHPLNGNSGRIQVATSTGKVGLGFRTPRIWSSNLCNVGTCLLGDFSGDGKADVLVYHDYKMWMAWAR